MKIMTALWCTGFVHSDVARALGTAFARLLAQRRMWLISVSRSVPCTALLLCRASGSSSRVYRCRSVLVIRHVRAARRVPEEALEAAPRWARAPALSVKSSVQIRPRRVLLSVGHERVLQQSGPRQSLAPVQISTKWKKKKETGARVLSDI